MKHFNKQNEFEYEIHFDISLACNNRCHYCFMLPQLDNSLKWNEEVFEKAIKEINDFTQSHKDYHFDIFLKGGEPMLVMDKSAEFIERVTHDNTFVLMFSNMNYKPGGSKIQKLKKVRDKVFVICSVHESSNHDFVKANILDINPEIHLILGKDNVDFIYDFAKWTLDNGLEYSVGYYNDVHQFMRSDKLDFIEQNGSRIENKVIIDDTHYTAREAQELDFKNISSQYHTICKINQFHITYDGTIKTLCGFEYERPLDEGLEIKEVFCNGKTCYCDTNSYKKLLKEKNGTV
jgi:organic radical activating enzyme